jgi:hypothetical protein
MCRGFGQLCSWAAVGFVAVLLIGPVAALVSVLLALVVTVLALLLPFVAIGFLVWGGYQVISRTPQSAWHNIRHAGKDVAKVMVVTPFQVCRGACVGTVNATRAVLERSWYTLGMIGRILLDALCGGAVGALLGSISMSDNVQDSVRVVVIATALGAVTGALVRVSQTRRIPREIPLHVEKAT